MTDCACECHKPGVELTDVCSDCVNLSTGEHVGLPSDYDPKAGTLQCHFHGPFAAQSYCHECEYDISLSSAEHRKRLGFRCPRKNHVMEEVTCLDCETRGLRCPCGVESNRKATECMDNHRWVAKVCKCGDPSCDEHRRQPTELDILRKRVEELEAYSKRSRAFKLGQQDGKQLAAERIAELEKLYRDRDEDCMHANADALSYHDQVVELSGTIKDYVDRYGFEGCRQYKYDGGDLWYTCGDCEWCDFAKAINRIEFEPERGMWRYIDE